MTKEEMRDAMIEATRESDGRRFKRFCKSVFFIGLAPIAVVALFLFLFVKFTN